MCYGGKAADDEAAPAAVAGDDAAAAALVRSAAAADAANILTVSTLSLIAAAWVAPCGRLLSCQIDLSWRWQEIKRKEEKRGCAIPSKIFSIKPRGNARKKNQREKKDWEQTQRRSCMYRPC